jgi:glycerol-3-phosphate dehydrogenase
MDISIRFYLRSQDRCEEFNRERRIKSVTELVAFNSNAVATNSIADALKGADFVFLCIPAQTLSEFFKENQELLDPKSIIVNCAKGMALKERKFISQIFAEYFPDRTSKYTVLSGPSFADEIFKKMPTVVTIAGSDRASIDQ